MLALTNIAAMLAPGGVFLHNEARPSMHDMTTALGLPVEQSRHAVIATVRGAPPARRQRLAASQGERFALDRCSQCPLVHTQRAFGGHDEHDDTMVTMNETKDDFIVLIVASCAS